MPRLSRPTGRSQKKNKSRHDSDNSACLPHKHVMSVPSMSHDVGSTTWVTSTEHCKLASPGHGAMIASGNTSADARKRWPCKMENGCCGMEYPGCTWRGCVRLPQFKSGLTPTLSSGHDDKQHLLASLATRKKLLNQLGQG